MPRKTRGGGPRRRGGPRPSRGSGQRGGPKPRGAPVRPSRFGARSGRPSRSSRGPARARAEAPLRDASEGTRLQTILARAGIASRREAERMIVEGRVAVNGSVVTALGTKAVPGRDHIKVDGKRIRDDEQKVYVLFYKPRGVITAVRDPQGRPCVVDFVRVRERIFPVGRLDWDTEGLLLLTNDGDLAYRLTHPKFEVTRVYHAKVRGEPVDATLERLRRGIHLEDGRARVENVRRVASTGTNEWLEVVVREGRNRLVRRVFQAVGHPVAKLKRVSFAGLTLGSLRAGQSRVLTPKEVEGLFRLTDRAAAAAPQQTSRATHARSTSARTGLPPVQRPMGRPPRQTRIASDDEGETIRPASGDDE